MLSFPQCLLRITKKYTRTSRIGQSNQLIDQRERRPVHQQCILGSVALGPAQGFAWQPQHCSPESYQRPSQEDTDRGAGGGHPQSGEELKLSAWLGRSILTPPLEAPKPLQSQGLGHSGFPVAILHIPLAHADSPACRQGLSCQTDLYELVAWPAPCI